MTTARPQTTRLIPLSAWLILWALTATASDAVELVEKRIQRVENGLLPAAVAGASPAAPWNIRDRMLHYRVPGVSIAIIDNFAVDWARGYGVLEAGGTAPVDTETLFQAASLSKPVAALGILSLVEAGKIGLDEEVNRKLFSWRIPDNAFTSVRGVTVRHLLTHTAGTTISGYVGYAAGQPLPTIVQILNGQRPSNSPPVRVEHVPGTQFRYSGGGFTVLQQLAIDLTGVLFPEWMRSEVLDKLEMGRSVFEQPLPAALAANAASGHLADGAALRGKWMIHPELAAAGLWTTPTDVARFVIELQKSVIGQSNRVISADMTRQMLTVQAADWGLGMNVLSEGTVFAHTGSNAGFKNILYGLTHAGKGAVVMTNSDVGQELRMEILRAIAAEYGWPFLRVAGYPPGAPVLAGSNAVVNGASGLPFVAPGSVVRVTGPDLTDVSEVLFNGVQATVLASTAEQNTAVLPAGIGIGAAIVQVRRGGISSTGRIVHVHRYAPGIFTVNQQSDGPGLIVHADSLRLVTESEPARRGEVLSILCTGLGAGGAEPVVTLGGVTAPVLGSGPLPADPGVQRVDIQVPEDAPTGTAVPALLRVEEAASNSVTLVIE